MFDSPSQNPLPVALIGAGRMASTHARVLANSSFVRIDTVLDALPEPAARLAEQFGARAATDPTEVWDNPDIGAVIITTPTATHAELIERAAAHGKHIFVEKPLAHNLAAGERALAAVEAAGVQCQVGFQRRFDASHLEAKRRIDAGELGTLEGFRGVSRDPYPAPLAFLKTSGGLMMDFGIHDLDSARFFIGEIRTVQAMEAALAMPELQEHGLFNTAVATLAFENGALGTLEVGLRTSYGYEIRCEILGELGHIHIEQEAQHRLKHYDERGARRTLPANFGERFHQAYSDEIRTFAERVHRGEPVAPNAADALGSLKLTLGSPARPRQRRDRRRRLVHWRTNHHSGGTEMTCRMTVGQALVRFLAAQHSELDGQRQRLIAGVWGIFGHGNVAGLGQALHELGNEVEMPFYRPQNEQGQVHLAAAYARHHNRLSTFACTASVGPGSSNMVTGAALATVNRLPVLLLPSDFFANRIPDPVLQQVEHPIEHDLSVNDIFRPVSRFYSRISRPEQLLHALPEAMRVLTDPAETGAVVLSLPEDVQAEAFDWPEEMFEPRVWRVRRPVPEAALIREAAQLLRDAEAPLIVAGGGVKYSQASAALAAFAEAQGIPVSETQAGRGAIPWDHPMNVGAVGAIGGTAANQLAAEADVVLTVGTRLGDFVTGSKTTFRPDASIIGLNVSPMDAHKLFALPLVADALRGLEALAGVLRGAGSGARRDDRIADLKREWDGIVDEIVAVQEPSNLAQGEVIGMVNRAFGGDATMICAAGSMPGDLVKLWRPSDPLAYHVEYGYSCMGYEIPAGIGVAMADPGRQVVVMIGDGSYLMMNSEIVTASVEGVSFTVVLVDNHGFQSIHGLQRSTGTPHFGLELRYRDDRGELGGDYVPVDYAAHARAMGAHAVHCSSEAELHTALEEAKGRTGVNVIVVSVDPEKRVGGYAFGGWWDVPIAEATELESVRAARQRYHEERKKQVLFK